MNRSERSTTIGHLLDAAAEISTDVARTLADAAAAKDDINRAIGAALAVSPQLSALTDVYRAALSLHRECLD
jgi:hypothetical protein